MDENTKKQLVKRIGEFHFTSKCEKFSKVLSPRNGRKGWRWESDNLIGWTHKGHKNHHPTSWSDDKYTHFGKSLKMQIRLTGLFVQNCRQYIFGMATVAGNDGSRSPHTHTQSAMDLCLTDLAQCASDNIRKCERTANE